MTADKLQAGDVFECVVDKLKGRTAFVGVDPKLVAATLSRRSAHASGLLVGIVQSTEGGATVDIAGHRDSRSLPHRQAGAAAPAGAADPRVFGPIRSVSVSPVTAAESCEVPA